MGMERVLITWNSGNRVSSVTSAADAIISQNPVAVSRCERSGRLLMRVDTVLSMADDSSGEVCPAYVVSTGKACGRSGFGQGDLNPMSLSGKYSFRENRFAGKNIATS